MTRTGQKDPVAREEVSVGRPSWLRNPPRHVAIIMDGNGRWARKRHMPRIVGHRAGATAVRTIVTATRSWDIPYLTLYAFSWENWSRPRQEVDALMGLLEEYIDREIRTMMEREIRFSSSETARVFPRPSGARLPGQRERQRIMGGWF